MANEHVIDVKVRADVTALSKGLSQAQQDLEKLQEEFSKYKKRTEDASNATQGFVEKNRGHMETIGKDAAIMGGAVVAGIALAVHAYAEFSGRMAQVQSLSHAGAGEMDVLTKSALSMGTAFGLSANDVADAEIELVKAGVSVKEMMGGALPGALALAAAGQIDVGKATEIATIALTQFNLKGKDVPHVADLLAAGADKALGGVGDLGEGLKQGGLVASQFGLTIDDTVGTLSAFANAGLLGSDAGTSMKTMFLALASPSKQAQAALDQYNITAYDSKGAFIGVTALAGQLHDKLGGLSDAQRNAALSTIFGTDAMRSASVLMKEGSDGIQKWIKDVNDQGFAAVQAAGKMNSLNGDVQKLQAAFETGLIKMGSTADGALRPAVQAITGVIQAFSNLSPGIQGAGLAVAGLAGGALLLGGAILTVIPKISDTVSAVGKLSEAAPRATGVIKDIGKAAGIAAASLAALQILGNVMNISHEAGPSMDKMANSLISVAKGGQSVSQVFSKDIFANANSGLGVADINSMGEAMKLIETHDPARFFNDLAKSVTGYESQVHIAQKTVSNLDGAMANFTQSGNLDIASKGFKQIADEAKGQGISLEATAKSFPQYMDSLRKLSTDLKVPLTDQELLNWALGEVPQKMKDAQNSTEGQAKMAELAAQATEAQKKALDDLGISANGLIGNLEKLITAMQASGLISISADQAAINYQKSLEAVDAAIAKNGKTLDITTKAGKENKEAWLGQASAANAANLANAKNGMSAADLNVQLTDQYGKLKDNAIAMGASADQADIMARNALGIPKDVKIETAIQNYADTMAKAQAIKDILNGIPSHKTIFFTTDATGFYDPTGGTNGKGAGTGGKSNGSPVAYADGGAIYGKGPKGVDSVRAVLAPGEHVLTADEVDRMGGQAGVYAMRAAIKSGAAYSSNGSTPTATVTQPVTFSPQITVTGGADTGAVVQEVWGKFKFEAQKAGLRIGG